MEYFGVRVPNAGGQDGQMLRGGADKALAWHLRKAALYGWVRHLPFFHFFCSQST